MSFRVHPAQGERNPHLKLTRLVIDHLSHAQEFPDRMAELARRLEVVPHVALAIAISDHIVEEFVIEDRQGIAQDRE